MYMHVDKVFNMQVFELMPEKNSGVNPNNLTPRLKWVQQRPKLKCCEIGYSQEIQYHKLGSSFTSFTRGHSKHWRKI